MRISPAQPTNWQMRVEFPLFPRCHLGRRGSSVGHGAPDKGFPFTFHYCIGAGDVFNLYATMWNTVKTNKNVGTMYMDSPAGRGFSDPQHGLPPILKKNGYKDIATGFFQVGNDDFSNQLATMKAGEASIVSGTCYPSHFATFWNQAAQVGVEADVVTVAGPFLFPGRALRRWAIAATACRPRCCGILTCLTTLR